MRVAGFSHFGGRHAESAAIRNILAFHGTVDPATGKPFTEAMCFGIAGGIGAGYSFCPSVVRHGAGSGVAVIGRHKIYATSAVWYQDFAGRIGAMVHITETNSPGKALANLKAELAANRPTVVWSNLCGHSFVVHALDEKAGMAYGSDVAATEIPIPLDYLAKARAAVCSHRNRTLTLDPPKKLSLAKMQSAVLAGIQACAQEMLHGRMKTFSLPGLEIWAKAIANSKSPTGWPRVFRKHLMFLALRDVFQSIETSGTGRGLYRNIYADFLSEAARAVGSAEMAYLADAYRSLARQWSELADICLPNSVAAFKRTKQLLLRKEQMLKDHGVNAAMEQVRIFGTLAKIEADIRAREFPLGPSATAALLVGLRERIIGIHSAERTAAERLGRIR